jgi:hypothetical protein
MHNTGSAHLRHHIHSLRLPTINFSRAHFVLIFISYLSLFPPPMEASDPTAHAGDDLVRYVATALFTEAHH